MEHNAAFYEKEYETMMGIARDAMDPEWKNGQVIVLKTHSGKYHWAKISDLDASIREPLEDQLLRSLIDLKDTSVLMCLCTMDGTHPEIPSWHLRSRLVEINSENLQTETFLWGGDDNIFVKTFAALLPPKKS